MSDLHAHEWQEHERLFGEAQKTFKKHFKVLQGKVECATKGSAAFDLFATQEVTVGRFPVAVPTGVFTEFDESLVAIIKERSGLALKYNLDIKAGVIDSDYKLEWKVVMRCLNDYPFVVGKGHKIAQFLIVEKPKIEITGVIFKDDERDGGFGSTDS